MRYRDGKRSEHEKRLHFQRRMLLIIQCHSDRSDSNVKVSEFMKISSISFAIFMIDVIRANYALIIFNDPNFHHHKINKKFLGLWLVPMCNAMEKFEKLNENNKKKL